MVVSVYISSEQTGSGQVISVNGCSMYISAVVPDHPKSSRIAVYWQEEGMSLGLSGHITASEAVGLVAELTQSR